MYVLKKLGILLLCLFIPLFTGGLAGLLTASDGGMYETIDRPPLSPPGWLFPVGWIILYTLMGLATYIAVTRGKGRSTLWMVLYGITIALNFVWPFLFFKARAFMLSFLWILLMWAVGFVLTRELWLKQKAAGVLLLPYMAWLSFAAYLCYGIATLN